MTEFATIAAAAAAGERFAQFPIAAVRHEGRKAYRCADSRFLAFSGGRSLYGVVDLTTGDYVCTLTKGEVPRWLHDRARNEAQDIIDAAADAARPVETETAGPAIAEPAETQLELF